MTNITIIFVLLVTPYLVASLLHFNHPAMAGRIGVSAVFLFTAIGHFIKTDEMIPMLPRFVPARRTLIYISGVGEVLLAVAVVLLPNKYVGWAVIIYLVVIFPSNVYASFQRISFGGHSIGPRYLFVRFPLQSLLILWIYWFCVRSH